MEAAPPRRRVGTPIHISTLDGIVNVNSLFTLAVFIGLAWNPADPNNSLIMDTETDTTCIAGSSVAEDLVSFHVYSFSSFLFSSLVALALKQAIRIARSPAYHPVEFLAHVNKTALRVGMLVSGAGSVSGCGFLMMALVNVVQIKLGTLACGSSYSLAAVVPLVILEYKKQPRVGRSKYQENWSSSSFTSNIRIIRSKYAATRRAGDSTNSQQEYYKATPCDNEIVSECCAKESSLEGLVFVLKGEKEDGVCEVVQHVIYFEYTQPE